MTVLGLTLGKRETLGDRLSRNRHALSGTDAKACAYGWRTGEHPDNELVLEDFESGINTFAGGQFQITELGEMHQQEGTRARYFTTNSGFIEIVRTPNRYRVTVFGEGSETLQRAVNHHFRVQEAYGAWTTRPSAYASRCNRTTRGRR